MLNKCANRLHINSSSQRIAEIKKFMKGKFTSSYIVNNVTHFGG